MVRRRPGPTGRFPHGKLDRTDEGELAIGISATTDGAVRLDFGKPVAWMAMSAQDAAGLAATIIKHARAAARVKGEVIELEL